MVGQIIYKDGATEPILHYDEHDGYCEVIAPSGKYAYQPFINVVADYKYLKPEFFYYDSGKHEWCLDVSIKEFQCFEEV